MTIEALESSETSVQEIVEAKPGPEPCVMVPTVCARLGTCEGLSAPLRMLCDTGAQINVVSEDWANEHVLNSIEDDHMSIYGIGGGKPCSSNGIVKAALHDRYGIPIGLVIELRVMQYGQFCTPSSPVASTLTEETIPRNKLADPTYNQRRRVTGILGVGVCAALSSAKPLQLDCGFAAQPTPLGFVVMGEKNDARASSWRHGGVVAMMEAERER